ncbi:hypothetical protein [Pedobacter nototheniae]|uniref:hypothetical protein n=1 Tax=Pedobacter nototheniae TaxID=2488994 RepID=UPI00292E00FB|nr:hypothetical protein [Pedobacter nototheniae]
MKKLNLLSKAEMKNVSGGKKELCVLTVTYAGGGSGSGDYVLSGSSGANDLCVHWITTGQVASCGYDCAHDGFGQ